MDGKRVCAYVAHMIKFKCDIIWGWIGFAGIEDRTKMDWIWYLYTLYFLNRRGWSCGNLKNVIGLPMLFVKKKKIISKKERYKGVGWSQIRKKELISKVDYEGLSLSLCDWYRLRRRHCQRSVTAAEVLNLFFRPCPPSHMKATAEREVTIKRGGQCRTYKMHSLSLPPPLFLCNALNVYPCLQNDDYFTARGHQSSFFFLSFFRGVSAWLLL